MGIDERVRRFAEWASSRNAIVDVVAVRGHSEHEATATVRTRAGTLLDVYCRVRDSGEIEATSFHMNVGPSDLEVRVMSTATLDPSDHALVCGLFAACYEDADVAYIDASCATVKSLVLASRDGRLVGFYFGDVEWLDLPGLPAQLVWYAGLACVDPECRRSGVSKAMGAAFWQRIASPAAHGERVLGVSRYAHAGSYSADLKSPGLVPAPGRGTPTDWQREVAVAVAMHYGVERFDAERFVCVGPGRPIGMARVEVDAPPEVLALFRDIDRARGDTLLTLMWIPDVPTGW